MTTSLLPVCLDHLSMWLPSPFHASSSPLSSSSSPDQIPAQSRPWNQFRPSPATPPACAGGRPCWPRPTRYPPLPRRLLSFLRRSGVLVLLGLTRVGVSHPDGDRVANAGPRTCCPPRGVRAAHHCPRSPLCERGPACRVASATVAGCLVDAGYVLVAGDCVTVSARSRQPLQVNEGDEMRAFGFSPDGLTFVIVASPGLAIYRHEDEGSDPAHAAISPPYALWTADCGALRWRGL